VRDGVSIARYALKLSNESGHPPKLSLTLAIQLVLGEEALRYQQRR
jgi:hypothetical protein